MLSGNGKFDRNILVTDRECKQYVDITFNCTKTNVNRIGGFFDVLNKDLVINYKDFQVI